MALYSFEGVNDQCGGTSWVVQETGMLPLLSWDCGMTAWLKGNYWVQVCPRKKRKLQVIQKISLLRDHTRAQMAFIKV